MASTGETEQVDAVGTTLGARFETQPNALNFLRLCLALEVVVWHAYGLRGATWLPTPVEKFLGDVAVDSFFAISGFLIVRAWCRNPDPARYLLARAGRILPGLWVCLLVTAFALAQDGSAGERWGYVMANADTWGIQYGISGGPVGLPHPGAWNGSLWSLGYETGCYLAVLTLGLAGMLRARVAVAVACVLWLAAAGFSVAGVSPSFIPRTGLMFAVGALAWFYRDRVPVSGRLAVAAAALTGISVVALPDYRLAAAPAVAYLALVGGVALGRHPVMVLRNDLSYGVYIYGFPIQQALLLAGVSLGWPEFAALSAACVLPTAAASWWWVERPALAAVRMTGRGRRDRVAECRTEAPSKPPAGGLASSSGP